MVLKNCEGENEGKSGEQLSESQMAIYLFLHMRQSIAPYFATKAESFKGTSPLPLVLAMPKVSCMKEGKELPDEVLCFLWLSLQLSLVLENLNY